MLSDSEYQALIAIAEYINIGNELPPPDLECTERTYTSKEINENRMARERYNQSEKINQLLQIGGMW